MKKRIIAIATIISLIAATFTTTGCASSADEIEIFAFRIKGGTTSAGNGSGSSKSSTSSGGW